MVDDESDADPVIQRLQFGERARQHREVAGIEFAEADARLGGYTGKLSKIENGVIAAKPPDVELMIKLYGLAPQEADELQQLGKEARRRSAPKSVSGKSRQYVSLERSAAEIRMVYNEVPGLLQTADYAYAALSQSPMVPGGDAHAQAEARALRGTQIVQPDGPRIWIVLGIEALHREVGGPAVLCDQLRRLREIADMPNVSLRIIPWEAGVSPALSCPFTLLYVKPARTIAYVESLTRPDYIKATGSYLAAFEHATRIAADEDDARVILDSRISDLSKGS
jgi:hypothetical protein